MNLEYPAPNTTVCPDTQENWREFWALKARVCRCSVGDAIGDFYKGKEDQNPFRKDIHVPTKQMG
jgi:hypothetical protein